MFVATSDTVVVGGQLRGGGVAHPYRPDDCARENVVATARFGS